MLASVPTHEGPYDVHLWNGCQPSPGERLGLVRHEVDESQVQARLVQPTPGFLGLDLTLNEAEALLRKLKACGAHGFVVPSAYRQPPIALNRAYRLAKNVVERKRRHRSPPYQVGPLTFRGDRSFYWEFFAPVPELLERGVAPGGIFAFIDKCDGHDWTLEEQDRLFAA